MNKRNLQLRSRLSPLITLIVSCGMFVYALIHYLAGKEISNQVFFGGDSWNYQGLAVNLALGHGYQEGAAEPFETYKFKRKRYVMKYPIGSQPGTTYDVFVRGPRYYFYRTPGYPAFVALIYRLSGVHPRNVKLVQIILLSLSAAGAVLVSYLYWRNLGLISGTVAGLLFVHFYSPDPRRILSEGLIVAGLFLWALISFWYQRKPHSHMRLFALGTVSGVLLLIKGLTIFIPLGIILFLFLRFGFAGAMRLLPAFLISLALIVAPWSYYASSRAGEFIVLATHGKTLLIDSNNEGTLHNGAWEPAWRKIRAGDQRYMVNRPEYASYSSAAIVALFLCKHWEQVPSFLLKKFLRAFGAWRNWVPLVLTLLFYGVAAVRPRPVSQPLFGPIFAVNILLITFVFYGLERFVLPFMVFFVMVGSYAVLSAGISCLKGRWSYFQDLLLTR